MSRISKSVALAASLALLCVACGPEDGPRAYVLVMGTRGNDSSVTITGDDVAFAARNAGVGFSLRTTRMGRERRLEMPPAETSRELGDMVVLDRGVVEERFLTAPKGLEQSWLLDTRPEGMGELAIEVRFEGVTPSLRAPGVAQLRDAAGWARGEYRDLLASDATGRAIPSRMEVVGDAVRLVIDDRGAEYPILVDPILVTEQTILTADDGGQDDRFGMSVDISGDTVVAGAPRKDADRGVVYVFTRTGDAWTQQAKLSPIDDGSASYFGASVALSGDTVVVGAGYNTSASIPVFLFTRSGASWTQEATLTAGDGEPYLRFGESMAISGDTIVVGAGADITGSSATSGAVYVFTRSGPTWTKQAKLTVGAASWTYGTAVAIAGDTIVVGDPGLSYETGAVYVFTRNGSTWTEQATLTASNPQHYSRFGTTLSLSAQTLVVGKSGAPASVFVRSGATWSEQAMLNVSNASDQEAPSWNLGLSGDLAVVSPQPNHSDHHAYVFARSGAAWFQQAMVQGNGLMSVDGFGCSIGIEDRTFVVADSNMNWGTGAVYVFSIEKASVGDPCSGGTECASTYCVDGVCCESACGGGNPDDCQACSESAGAPADGTCGVVSDGSACDDGDGCTQTDVCESGVCLGSNPLTCPVPDQCHEAGTCDSTTGLCSNPATPDGTGCDDGNPNTADDICTAGVCTGENRCANVTCAAEDDCHDAVCVPPTGLCLSSPRSDGTPCAGGTCVAGTCSPQQHPDASSPDADAVVDASFDAEAAPQVEASTDSTVDSASNRIDDVFASGGGCGCRTDHKSEGDASWLAMVCLCAIAARRRRDAMS